MNGWRAIGTGEVVTGCATKIGLGKFTKVVARSLYNDIKEPVCAPNFVTIWSGNIAFVTRETYNNVYCIGH